MCFYGKRTIKAGFRGLLGPISNGSHFPAFPCNRLQSLPGFTPAAARLNAPVSRAELAPAIRVGRMSAFERIADVGQTSRHVRFVPTPDMPCYSITSSARVSSVGGTMMPSAFAVFKLITSSYLVGCSTGRSAGFAPLKILSTKNADRRYRSRRSAP